MNKERYSEFIKGIDLQEIFLIDVECSRKANPEGNEWHVEFKPAFDVVHDAASNLIEVTADFCATVKNEGNILFSVQATFLLRYSSSSDIEFDQEIRKIFLKSNPPLNSWPYAREIISSLTTRMGFPPLIIEPYKVY